MVFFVTGGSRGLGAAIVLEAVAAGHDVAFTYLSNGEMAAEVEKRALELRPDARCRSYQLDVGDSEQVDAVSEQVLDDFDTVDVVVSNAGVNRDNLLVSMSNEEWDAVLRTNLTGSFYVCRAFLQNMLANRFGRILLMSSIVHNGASGQANYCASKAGLHGLAAAIAKEYGKRGITANVLVPGFFDTPMTQETMSEGNKDFWMHYCPQGRMGELSEIGKTAVFMASEGAGFINGQIIPLTGGLDWGALNPVGIERIGIWPGTLSLSMDKLCAARGDDPADMRDVMFIDQRSVNPLWEDPVTTAVNAADRMLTEEDRARIELLIVASESGVDYEKPMSTWVQRYLGLTANCRNFEVKHACYGGTSGLQMAAHWIASGLHRGAKALLICTDQSRTHLGKPWEYVLGAGAAAILISDQPRIVELELGKSGYWTHEVSDLVRPTGRVETGNSETSLVSYIDALDNSFDHFCERNPELADYENAFKKHVYHAPFGGMTYRAHKTLLRRFGRRSKQEMQAHFDERTGPSLIHSRRFGGAYSASTFLGLLGLTEACDDLAGGDRISVFSYGSGSCAELYSTRYVDGAREVAQAAGATTLLDARRDVSVEEYERVETRRTELIDQGDYEIPREDPSGWYAEYYEGRKRLVFLGMSEYYRQYGWS